MVALDSGCACGDRLPDPPVRCDGDRGMRRRDSDLRSRIATPAPNRDWSPDHNACAVCDCVGGLRDRLDLAHGGAAQTVVLAARRRSVRLHLFGVARRLPARRTTWTTSLPGHSPRAAGAFAARDAALATHGDDRRRNFLLGAIADASRSLTAGDG